MSEQPQRPTSNDDRDGWKAYWAAQGMPWRTEPEIDEERQRELDRRRHKIEPNIEQGIYPFKDIEPKLTRADVEWLLATHESGGIVGPVDWSDEKQRERKGLDLRGANLHHVDLDWLPLARLQAGLGADEWHDFGPVERNMAAATLEGAMLRMAHVEQASFIWTYLQGASFYKAHLEGADLRDAHAEQAVFREAHLEGASLVGTHLEGANLRLAHFEGKSVPFRDPYSTHMQQQKSVISLMPATLRCAFFDTGTALNGAVLGSRQYGFVSVADARWGGTNLAVVRWSEISTLGDEFQARQPYSRDGSAKNRDTWLLEYEMAVRANRQLALVLRGQGLNEHADRFAYRAQVLQRVVLGRQNRFLRYLGSAFLSLISGYGYKPVRSFVTYLLVVGVFAITYYLLGKNIHPPLNPLGAIVFSITSFHGRGFTPGENVAITNPVTVIAAVEAIIGLLIEIIFIATFTQRFFAR